MQLARSPYAFAIRSFGRGPARFTEAPPAPPALTISNDLKLFASTFAGGFLFVSLLIA